MSNSIEADNYSPNNVKAVLVLDADVVPGATALTVLNTGGVSVNDAVYLDSFGSSQCEKVRVTAVTDQTHLAVSAAKLPHHRTNKAYAVYGDQVQFLWAPSPVSGGQPDVAVPPFAVLANVDIDPINPTTVFGDTDTGPAESRWYCYVYRDSVSGNTTAVSDAVAVQGGDAGNYCSLYDIRVEAGFKNATYVTDSDIDMYRRTAQDEANGMLARVLALPLPSPLPMGVETITRRLAAGYLMQAEWGPVSDTSAIKKLGNGKVEWAQDQLRRIANGSQALLDQRGAELGQSYSFSSYPDSTAPGPAFTRNQVF